VIPDIASALAARLGTWADAEGISVAWENVPFTPPANDIYLAVHDMPVTPRTIDLGFRGNRNSVSSRRYRLLSRD